MGEKWSTLVPRAWHKRRKKEVTKTEDHLQEQGRAFVMVLGAGNRPRAESPFCVEQSAFL